MNVVHWKECEDVEIKQFPYKGKKLEVIGTSIRWLSQHGDDGNHYPEYGLCYSRKARLARKAAQYMFPAWSPMA